MRINWIGHIGLLFVMVSVVSCSVKQLPEQDLKSYILNEENGLYKRTVKGDVTIEVFYRPAELVWKSDLQDAKDEGALKELRKNYDTLNYFMMHFSRKGQEIENSFVSNPSYFTEVINYLSFEMSKDVFQINGLDTVRALDVVYTRTFGGSAGTSVMAVFNGNLKERSENIKICFNDTKLGIGAAEFEFKSSDIKNTPTLILN
jgi:hypothetical protein